MNPHYSGGDVQFEDRKDGSMQNPKPRWLNKNEKNWHLFRSVVAIGLILSLSMGFLDIVLSISSRPSEFSSSFLFVLSPLIATVVFFFIIYVCLWFLISSLLARFFRIELFPLATSLAVFLGLIFTLSSMNDLSDIFLFSTKNNELFLSPNKLFKLSMLFSISFLISMATYYVARIITLEPNYRNTCAAITVGIPLVLAEMAIFVWLQKYKIGHFLSLPSLLASGGFVLVALFTILLFYQVAGKIGILRLLAIFTMVLILSPFLSLIGMNKSQVSSEILGNTNRKIKHVILIIVDTLRPDFLSCYGWQRISTPNIDKLAKDGVLFSKAISSAPWTLPSVASIMTGLSPSVHMATKMDSKLSDSLMTLAEYMRDAAYHTAAIGSNVFLKRNHNVSQGFLHYDFFPKARISNSFGSGLLHRLFPNAFKSDASTHDLTELACNWLEENYKRDFFLWIHYFDPHLPYTPPPDFVPKSEPPRRIGKSFSKLIEVRGGYLVPSLPEREWIKGLYSSEIRYVDENIGTLINTLKRLNSYDESLIIFTSDHGEEFWEHGGFEHGHTLFNEVIWVPLIIKLPLSAVRGEIDKVVSTGSITPTVLDLCKIDYEREYLSVESLLPLWRDNPHKFDEKPIFTRGLSYFEDRESVIFNGLKYVHFLISNHEELYDLYHDPKEQVCIATSSQDKVQIGRNILREYDKTVKKLREHYGISETKRMKFNKETIERLKSLGYMQ